MSSYNTDSDAEYRVIETSRRMMGASLSDFLLSGLGEPSHPGSRSFTAKGTDGGEEVTYLLKIVSDSDFGLPAGKDPLVMASVLSLISARGGYSDEIALNTSSITEALAWPTSQSSRLTVEQAVERYCSAAYYMAMEVTHEPGLPGGEYPHYSRLLAGYDIEHEELEGLPTVESGSITVKFIPGFLRGISTERKFLFGVDFERLKELRESL
jgi:hypothetical protein